MRHAQALYRAEQVRALDQAAAKALGVERYELMERAGHAVFQVIRNHWSEVTGISICCGGGNNGGDGWVVARLARQAGLAVQVITTHEPSQLRGDAALAYEAYRQCEGDQAYALATTHPALDYPHVVDALVGTGLRGPLQGLVAQWVGRVNQEAKSVIAIDVPSGLLADAGTSRGECIRADFTVTLIGHKQGLLTGQAGRYRGQLVFSDLEVPKQIYEAVGPCGHLMAAHELKQALPKRAPDTHKGDLGRVVVVGGDAGMTGASVLSAVAALESGSGLVEVLGRGPVEHAALSHCLALMAHQVSHWDEMKGALARADVLAVGPGLGQSPWADQVMSMLLQCDQPLVVDADGLNALARQPATRNDWILTPHPQEAARLLDVSVAEIESDRIAAVQSLSERYQAVVVLKGWGSLVAEPGGAWSLCPYGSSQMASAGMGDVLTGVIASLWGQGLEAYDAARWGVMVHALAGEASATGRYATTAPRLINNLSHIMALSL